MDFELDEEIKQIRKAVREFAQAEIEPVGQEYDKSEEWPEEIYQKACDLGYVGVTIPEEYGGMGLSHLANIVIGEELCRADSGVGYCIHCSDLAIHMVLMYGTEEQKKKYVSKIPKGGVCALGITEPDAGSDVVGIKTRAKKDGDEWVLNGNKMYTTNATVADWAQIIAVTDPEAGHKGLSAFIVDTDADGFEASRIDKMGRHAQPTCDVALNDVRVPEENLIGEEGKGFYQVMDQLACSRINTAGIHLGIAQGAFDRALEYASEREAFGKQIQEFQLIQERLAEMYMKLEAMRHIVYKGAWKLDQGILPTQYAALSKLVAGDWAKDVCDCVIELYGGHGYASEYDVERFYRDAAAGSLVEGTSDIMRTIIANTLIGKLSEEKEYPGE